MLKEKTDNLDRPIEIRKKNGGMSMKDLGKRILVAGLLTALCVCPLMANGQKEGEIYPTDTIHMVVPWSAGGGTDSVGRALAEAMKETGAFIVVDNISGAAGVTGCIKVAQSKPDGYTILMNGDTDIIAALTFADVPLSLDDFKYIGGFYDTPTWILSHKDSGITTFEQFLEEAKKNPGQLTLGSATPAGAQMIMASAIKGNTGLDFRIIPYQSGADLKKALLGNQINAGIIHAPVMLAEVESGLINVIGSGNSLKRISYKAIRGTQTLKDIGINVTMGITRGIFVPKDTPDEIVIALTAIVKEAAESENFAKFGSDFGFDPTWISGAEFEANMREFLDVFQDVKVKYID
jgi:tripartite-type tricarboxylate transporter receptor subunit TctC